MSWWLLVLLGGCPDLTEHCPGELASGNTQLLWVNWMKGRGGLSGRIQGTVLLENNIGLLVLG